MGKNDVGRVGTPTQRLWKRTHVNPETGCYEWTGHITNKGYGTIHVDGDEVYVHRFSHQAFIGDIPSDLEIDHLCRNRKCWRPDHIEAVLPRVNKLRGMGAPAINARRTHCTHGHEFTPANTYIWRGARYCKQCNVDKQRVLRERRKVSA